ncbi:hypothetical protein [Streptomyces sp. NPDC003006]
MKRLLEFLGVVLLIRGAGGVVHEVTDERHGWGLLRRFGVLDDRVRLPPADALANVFH